MEDIKIRRIGEISSDGSVSIINRAIVEDITSNLLTKNTELVLRKMKSILLPILILLLTSPLVYTEELHYQYPKVTLELEGDRIILKQGENTYSFPHLQEEYVGIRKVLQEDIDGDGEKEYILAVQLEGVDDLPKFPYGVILIAERRENKLDVQNQIVVGNILPDFELIDVNKDGIKDIIASGWEPIGWRHLKIISWQDGKYVFLWNKGENQYVVEQSFEINRNGDAQIKVGLPFYGEGGSWFNAQEWKIWVWDGKEFKQKKQNE